MAEAGSTSLAEAGALSAEENPTIVNAADTTV